MMPRKLAKTVRIFVEIKHIKNWGVTFIPKELDGYFPRYGVVMSLVTNSVKFHDRPIAWQVATLFSQAKM
jgi:hypothetical protein